MHPSRERSGDRLPPRSRTQGLGAVDKPAVPALGGYPLAELRKRRTALERIEDELDLRAWSEAKAEFDADPVIIPASEIAKRYL